jgi:hypothetical protein
VADNVDITAGSGTTIATDQVGSVHYPIGKTAFGADGVATLVTSTVGMPVELLNPSIAVTAASLPLPTGAATEATVATLATAANQSTLNGRIGDLTEAAPASDTASSGLNGRLQRIAQRLTSLLALIPSALTGSGNFKVALVESTAAQAVTQSGTWNVGAVTSITNTVATLETKPASSALTSVASSATSVSLLASNASRRGVILFNDSTAVLYVKLGATASTTSFSYKLAAGATLELPSPVFTGAIDGLWASANGSARITETS